MSTPSCSEYIFAHFNICSEDTKKTRPDESKRNSDLNSATTNQSKPISLLTCVIIRENDHIHRCYRLESSLSSTTIIVVTSHYYNHRCYGLKSSVSSTIIIVCISQRIQTITYNLLPCCKHDYPSPLIFTILLPPSCLPSYSPFPPSRLLPSPSYLHPHSPPHKTLNNSRVLLIVLRRLRDTSHSFFFQLPFFLQFSLHIFSRPSIQVCARL